MLEQHFKKKEEIKDLEKKTKEADISLNEIGDIARKCLGHEDFRRYRDQYAKVEAQILDVMITYTNQFANAPEGDVSKYAFTIMRYITKLQDLRALLVIQKDAMRGPKPEEKSEQ